MRNQTIIFSADQENGQPNGGAKEVAEKPKGRKRRVPLVAHANAISYGLVLGSKYVAFSFIHVLLQYQYQYYLSYTVA